MEIKDITYLQRCVSLANLANEQVLPNPKVGAVLVYANKIIGEGYHKKYGDAHAEINALESVSEENKKLIEHSTLYVSLEPCHHYGKTPPCTKAIVEHKIKKVIIGTQDYHKKVDGKGIAFLKEQNVEVEIAPLTDSFFELNKIFFTNKIKERPYLHLKWAESAHGFMGKSDEIIFLSNAKSNLLTHQLRSQYDGILIGYNTAMLDNPFLTVRNIKGKNPTRIVLDWQLNLKMHLNIFKPEGKVIIVNSNIDKIEKHITYLKCEKNVKDVLKKLYNQNIYSILVEGGSKTLHDFIKSNLWDEITRIKTNKMIVDGIKAPAFLNGLESTRKVGDDWHEHYKNKFDLCGF